MSINWGDFEFDGPHKLQDWEPPRASAVYAIMFKGLPVKEPSSYTIAYFGEAENLAARGFPFNHERAHCWIGLAGSRSNVYIGLHFMPGSTAEERREIERELIDKFRPDCNRES